MDQTSYRKSQFDVPDHISLPEGTFPVLVPVETWERAQEWMGVRHESQGAKSKRPQEALLTGGMVRCGYCGRIMHAKWWTGRYQNYQCSTPHRESGETANPSIAVRKLDTSVWTRVEAFMSQPALILEELRRYRTADPTAEDVAAVDRRIRELERQQSNLVRRMAVIDDDDIVALVMGELDSLKVQQRLHTERDRITARRSSWEQAQHHIDNVEQWVATVSANLEDLTREEKRTLLAALDVRVKVWRTDHDPRYVIEAAVPLEINPQMSGTCRRPGRC